MDGEKFKRKLSKVNARAVSRGQNEFVGKLCYLYFSTFLSTWSTNLCKLLNFTRSITFELPLKGILNFYMNSPVFPPNCFQLVYDSLIKNL